MRMSPMGRNPIFIRRAAPSAAIADTTATLHGLNRVGSSVQTCRSRTALEDGTPAEGDYELLVASPPEQERNQDQNQHNEDDDEELQRRQREDMDMNSRTPIAFEALAERTLFFVACSSSYAALIAGKCHMFWIQVQMASTGRRANPSTVVGRVSFRFGSSGYSSDNSDELRAVALPLFQSVD
ncbi:hypothetical protein PHYSODRAFT_258492 [Phytophthora sojae]|uniref:Uncharacterized protein n=1 Tax=Phytophthora sojae (strain P6497) TaxID=1094619 RepID=G4YY51_PHYSP|nr:hypothetical protein PHYSODRAFT_258492 [Phytophthora sojae]EGZ26219.1 hypothetical protein PHYSODRAFT_258492 [Phytophthora sojae]|eukprot:XP_009521507.1 hypothetical protein PHYSODRAFT_258492 [Phytophthora sojae]